MPNYRSTPAPRDRAKAIGAVACVYAAMSALLLLARAGSDPLTQREPPTILIDIEQPVPPPPPASQRDRPRDEEGAAGKKAEPTEIVAPPPRIPAPSPVAAAPIAGNGAAANDGEANAGNGPGSGGSGTGRGGGGSGGSAAQYVSGGLRDIDYPREALRERAAGTVSIRFTVQTSGRIADCRVSHSSGSRELDDTTCRLLTDRLRFRPATDAVGRPVATELGSDFTWGIRQRRY